MGRGFLVLGLVLLCGAMVCGGSAQAVSLDVGTVTAIPPDPITVTADTPCGQTYCANVDYTFTAIGGVPPYRFVCNLSPGPFTVGSHNVSCLAQDAANDTSPPAGFEVTVNPPTGDGTTTTTTTTTPQTLSIVPPAPITAVATVACGSTTCADVTYSYTITGGSPPYRLVCNLDSGQPFPLGYTSVSCIGQDSEGDSTPPTAFEVTVVPPSSATGGTGGTGASNGSSSGGGTGAGTSGGSIGSTSGGQGGTPSGSSSNTSNASTDPTGTSASTPASVDGTSGKTPLTPPSPPTVSITSLHLLDLHTNSPALLIVANASGATTLDLALLAPSGKRLARWSVEVKQGSHHLRLPLPRTARRAVPYKLQVDRPDQRTPKTISITA